MLIDVSDQGPGVAPADKAHVFEPFFRGERQPENAVRGTGIGLSIVQEYIHAHGGRVHLLGEAPTHFSESNSLMHPEATHPRHAAPPSAVGVAVCVAVLVGCAISALQPQAAEAIEVAPPAATAEANRTPAPTPPERPLPELEDPHPRQRPAARHAGLCRPRA